LERKGKGKEEEMPEGRKGKEGGGSAWRQEGKKGRKAFWVSPLTRVVLQLLINFFRFIGSPGRTIKMNFLANLYI
jgi:hypothetical protein